MSNSTTPMTLQELCDKSFKITELIFIEYWPQDQKNGRYANTTAPFRPEPYLHSSNNQQFNSKNDIVAFVLHDTLHVIPKTDEIMELLVRERFVHQVAIAVPFADGSRPFNLDQNQLWENLLREAETINLAKAEGNVSKSPTEEHKDVSDSSPAEAMPLRSMLTNCLKKLTSQVDNGKVGDHLDKLGKHLGKLKGFVDSMSQK